MAICHGTLWQCTLCLTLWQESSIWESCEKYGEAEHLERILLRFLFLFCPKNRKRTQLEFEIKKFISKFTRFPCHHFFLFSVVLQPRNEADCQSIKEPQGRRLLVQLARLQARSSAVSHRNAEEMYLEPKTSFEAKLQGHASQNQEPSKRGAVERAVLSSCRRRRRLPTTSSDFLTSQDRFMS